MIKNLMFDLGGVIMNIERSRCVRAFEALGMTDADAMLGEYGQQGPFAALESGELSAAEWRDAIRNNIGREVADEEIDRAFEQFLTGIPVHRLEALRKLRSRYRIYLLSNTNSVMWNGEIARQFAKEGRRREDYFDGMVTSFEAKAMKPAPEIFGYAEKTFGIRPEETIFLDDSADNCAAAARLGWNTATVVPGSEFVDILKERGIE